MNTERMLKHWRLVYEYPIAIVGVCLIVYGACTGRLAVAMNGTIRWRDR